MIKDKINRLTMRVAFGGALFFIACFVVIALLRRGYPFELEWIEGGILLHVQRILDGHPIYGPPSMDFVPLIYTPLYYYVSAPIAAIWGADFPALRGISLAASLACLVIIYLWVRTETQSAFAAVIAMGLLAATYRVGGAWLDLARVDSLFLCLLLFSLYLLKFGKSRSTLAVSAVLFLLSFLAKQSALTAGIPMAVLALLWHRKRGIIWIALSSTMVLGATLVIDQLHNGWFLYYAFKLPGSHQFQLARLTGFWMRNLVGPLFVALIYAAANIHHLFRKGKKYEGIGNLFVAATLMGSAFVSSLHSGSYDNVCLPAHAGLAILFGTSLPNLLHLLRTAPQGSVLSTILYLGISVQWGLLLYNPLEQLPSKEDSRQGESVLALIESFKGEVLVPRHGYLAWKMGKKPFAHEMAVVDVLRGDPGGEGKKLKREIGRALQEGRFDAIIVDYDWLKPDLEQNYEGHPKILNLTPDAFWPRTGMRTRPRDVYVLKQR